MTYKITWNYEKMMYKYNIIIHSDKLLNSENNISKNITISVFF